MYQSIYINLLSLTILIYRIKINQLVLSSMDLWRIWEDLWNYCQLLPTIAHYCQLLPTSANYCQLKPTIANYSLLFFNYCLLLPTFYCQLETSNWPDQSLGNVYPLFAWEIDHNSSQSSFRDHSLSHLNICAVTRNNFHIV